MNNSDFLDVISDRNVNDRYSLMYAENKEESIKTCSQLIFQACRSLNVSVMVAGTAVTYLYKHVSFLCLKELTGKHLLCGLPAIIYLACKTNEDLKPIRDIFNVVYVLRVGNNDPETLYNLYTDSKHDIIIMEHELIRILNFNFDVDLPYPYLLNLARLLELSRRPVQLALSLINDSFLAPRCMEFHASHLAVCAIYCALEKVEEDFRNNVPSAMKSFPSISWWRKCGVNDEDLLAGVEYLLSIHEQE